MNDEKYKQALEKLQEALAPTEDGCKIFGVTRDCLENIFPELKESEDEKIRKGLINGFKECLKDCQYPKNAVKYWHNVEVDSILAWLEKQGKQTNPYSGISFEYNGHIWGMCARDNGVDILLDKQLFKHLDTQGEQKPYGQRKECKDCQFNYAGECKGLCKMKRDEQKPADEDEPKFRPGDIVQYITDSTDRRKIEEIDTLCNMYHTDSSPIMFEVEDEWKVVVNAEDVEQKSADKVEPEFHEGDYIVPDNDASLEIWMVINIDKDGYYNIQCITNPEYDEIYRVPAFILENDYRLWTIADAKDGDVLASELTSSIFLFRGIKDDKIDFYCDYDAGLECSYNRFGINDSSEHYGSVEESQDIQPATKEQRDTLFAKMKEAGYEWNNEKKELKEIKAKTLDPDKVIEWLNDQACQGWIEDVEVDKFVDRFEKDFGL